MTIDRLSPHNDPKAGFGDSPLGDAVERVDRINAEADAEEKRRIKKEVAEQTKKDGLKNLEPYLSKYFTRINLGKENDDNNPYSVNDLNKIRYRKELIDSQTGVCADILVYLPVDEKNKIFDTPGVLGDLYYVDSKTGVVNARKIRRGGFSVAEIESIWRGDNIK